MTKKEQTQCQDDGTVLSLPSWAWCRAQCHEPNSIAEYFHQAPPDSPPHTLAGLGWPTDRARPIVQWSFMRVLMSLPPVYLWHYLHYVEYCVSISKGSKYTYILCVRHLRWCVSIHVHACRAIHTVSGSERHLLHLWRNGFSYSILIKTNIFIATSNSQLSCAPLIIDCKVNMTEWIQLLCKFTLKYLFLALDWVYRVMSVRAQCARLL